MYDPADTICAIGTAPRGAVRGMVRISGAEVVAVVRRVFVAADGTSLEAIQTSSVVEGWLNLARDGDEARGTDPPPAPPYKGGELCLPCCLYLWPGERSYTREPVAELHTVGAPPLLEAVLAALCTAGARLAEPGEFTLRAFLAGRLDLTQAEAVLGVIDANDVDDLHAALAQLAGGLAKPLHQLRDDLLQLLAELEAGLDFVEEDIRFISREVVLQRLHVASELLHRVAEQLDSRGVSQELSEVVLTGEPNVGKSSLFNALVERYGERAGAKHSAAPALVSSESGTTRDYLTATLVLGSRRCTIIDTAGIAESVVKLDSVHSIDAAAQQIASERQRRADVRICCFAAASGKSSSQPDDRVEDNGACDVFVYTKADLCGDNDDSAMQSLRNNGFQGLPAIATSSRTGLGLDLLSEQLQMLLGDESPRQGRDVVAATAERCRESLHRASASLETAVDLVRHHAGDELVASELRVALTELGKVVGAVYTDDLLDRIFKTFCIGK